MGMQVITANDQIEIERHFKVSAGPGAGKTRFLINHISNVLQSSNRLARAKKIACITYTNVGVSTILSRLGEELDHVEVSTIHSFLFKHIVRPYLFLLKDKYSLDLRKINNHYEHMVSSGFFNKTDLPRRNIKENELRSVYWEISGNECKLKLNNRKMDYHSSLLKYKMFFWDKGLVHHEDILAFSWEILKSSSEVVRVIRSKFPYFFIDEFQDTNPIQTEILKLIGEKETIVGVIGDSAQSIYEFQGASVNQFTSFKLAEILDFKIEDNHRSTEQIINVLNKLRNDLTQKSPKNKTGSKPLLIVGGILDCLEFAKKKIASENITTLSFSNLTANAVRNNISLKAGDKWQIIEDLYEDSNNDRRKVLVGIIKAVQFAKMKLYKESIRDLSRHFIGQDNFKGHRIAIIVLKSLLSEYDEIKSKSLWDFYLRIKSFCVDGKAILSIAKINESKPGKQPTKIEEFYKKSTFEKLSLHVKMNEDNSMHRTIHKAKGDEFENVMLIVKQSDQYRDFQEHRDLEFLFNPKLSEREDHRVYYVGCSRAIENLMISVPILSENGRNILSDYFEICDLKTLQEQH